MKSGSRNIYNYSDNQHYKIFYKCKYIVRYLEVNPSFNTDENL